MTACIILLVLAAFIASRLLKSTKMWWTLMFAMLAGLLVGVLSKEVVNSSKKDKETTSITQVVNTNDNELEITGTQSLVATVTEGTTVAYLGLRVTNVISNKLSKVITNNFISNNRASPEIINDS